MAWHHGGKGVELEVQIRVTGGDHFVIHEFFFCAEVTFEAFFRAMNDVTCVHHSQARRRVFVVPIAAGVRTEPGLRGPMAIFAGDPVGKFERTSALLRRNIEDMADQAFRSVFGFCVEF